MTIYYPAPHMMDHNSRTFSTPVLLQFYNHFQNDEDVIVDMMIFIRDMSTTFIEYKSDHNTLITRYDNLLVTQSVCELITSSIEILTAILTDPCGVYITIGRQRSHMLYMCSVVLTENSTRYIDFPWYLYYLSSHVHNLPPPEYYYDFIDFMYNLTQQYSNHMSEILEHPRRFPAIKEVLCANMETNTPRPIYGDKFTTYNDVICKSLHLLTLDERCVFYKNPTAEISIEDKYYEEYITNR